MVQETIPWRIKKLLIVKAVKKSMVLNKKRQIIFPVPLRENEYQVLGGKVYFWFNTVLEGSEYHSTHGVHIDLVDGEFPN